MLQAIRNGGGSSVFTTLAAVGGVHLAQSLPKTGWGFSTTVGLTTLGPRLTGTISGYLSNNDPFNRIGTQIAGVLQGFAGGLKIAGDACLYNYGPAGYTGAFAFSVGFAYLGWRNAGKYYDQTVPRRVNAHVHQA